MKQCDYLVPRIFGPGVPVGDDGIGECLLKRGHKDEHLVKTSMGYYLWCPEEEFCRNSEGKICDCDFIECYVYQYISDAQAKKLLAKDGAGTN